MATSPLEREHRISLQNVVAELDKLGPVDPDELVGIDPAPEIPEPELGESLATDNDKIYHAMAPEVKKHYQPTIEAIRIVRYESDIRLKEEMDRLRRGQPSSSSGQHRPK